MTPTPDKPAVMWAAFFEDRLAGQDVWRRPAIFRTKKDARQWARETTFRIARVEIREIKP